MTKSQLEKFQARMSKMKKDEHVIKQQELKNSTIEKKAEKIAKQHGVSTEEIFAIITRESIGGFVQLWNNSMETVLRETLRGEIREIIREVVREQMTEAYKGIITGMMDVESIVREEMMNMVSDEKKPAENPYKDIPNVPLGGFQLKPKDTGFGGCDLGPLIETPEQHMEEPEREKRVGTFKKKNKGGRPKAINNEDFEAELIEAIAAAHYEGVRVLVGKDFKKSSSRNSTLYQQFYKREIGEKGERGAWQKYVYEVLPQLKKDH
jgi:hypothetical protein